MPAFATFTPSPAFESPKQVAVVGYGSWGSAIARLVGKTITEYPNDFAPTVRMWVSEKMINGEKLTNIINTRHENVKYLPGKKLPHTVVAVPDLVETCQGAQILLFVVPHQCIDDVVSKLEGKIDPNAIAVSLIKGVSSEPDSGELKLISREIQERLNIDVSVLMGANLAPEVASDKFCEATIGSNASKHNISLLKKLFHSDNFRVNVVPDAASVELCGALKNVVACAAGFVDGLQSGDNTKAAVIRLGLMEITKFVEYYYPGARLSTFFESCGVADLVTSCYGGRNRRVCEAFVNCNKTMEEVEASLLNGQSAQGPLTAEDVYFLNKKTGMTEAFPLFTAVHKICKREIPAEDLIDCLRHHPEYTN